MTKKNAKKVAARARQEANGGNYQAHLRSVGGGRRHPMVVKCRMCRTREANSKEHVFPSALGGRWVVSGVLCKPCNETCGTGVDAELIRGFHDLRVMLGVEGDRGQTASVEKVDDQGRRLIVGAGMVPRPAEGPPAVIKDDGANRTVSLASERAARQYIKSFERKAQKFKINEASVHRSFPGRVQMELGFGGGLSGFRSCLKTVLTFIVGAGHEGDPESWVDAWRCVAGAPFEDCGVSVSFTSLPPPVVGAARGLGVVSHRVCARASGASALVEADLRFFGDLGVCLRISGKTSLPRFNIGYGLDPLAGTACRLDDWAGPVGVPGQADYDELAKALTAAVTDTVNFAEHRNADRTQKELIETALHEAFVDVPDGAPIPQEALVKLSRLVAERFVDQQYGIESSWADPELLARLTAASSRKK